MKKRFLSIVLALFTVATVLAGAFPAFAADTEETTEPVTTIEFVSDIIVYDFQTETFIDDNGDKYKGFNWFYGGIGTCSVNMVDEVLEYKGTPVNVFERFIDGLVDLNYTDSQADAAWEVGGTYPAQINYSVENKNGEISDYVLDVTVSVIEIPVAEDLTISGEITVTEEYIIIDHADDGTVYGYYECKTSAFVNATVCGTEMTNITIDEAFAHYCDNTQKKAFGLHIVTDQSPENVWVDGGTYDAYACLEYFEEDSFDAVYYLKAPVKVKIDSNIDLRECEVVSITAEPLEYAQHEKGSAFVIFTTTLKNGLVTTTPFRDIYVELPSSVGEHTVEVSLLDGKFTVPVSVTVTPTPTEGVWSDGFAWRYDASTSTLYIEGEGELVGPSSYSFTSHKPRNVVLGEGIETISQCALDLRGDLETLVLPSTLKYLPYFDMFANPITIDKLIIKEGIKAINHLPFGNCLVTINELYVPTSVTLLDKYTVLAGANALEGSNAIKIIYAGDEAQYEAISKDYMALRNAYVEEGTYNTMVSDFGYPANMGAYNDLINTAWCITANEEIFDSPYTVTVTWVGENGETIDSEEIAVGGDATKEPEVPEKEGHDGKWSVITTNVNVNTIIRPEYTIHTFTVTWVDENGEVIDTETVEYGKDATKSPAVPEKEGFVGKWSGSATEIKADTTLKAEYSEITFTVVWIDGNGNVVDTEIVSYGKDATKSPAIPEKEGYTGAWSTTATKVTSDVTITAEYDVIKFTVTWIDENGEVVETETVDYGKNATKSPTVPEKADHTGKWETVPTNVTTDIIVKPVYKKNIVVDNGTATVPDSAIDVTEGEDIVIDITDKTTESEPVVDSVVIESTTVDKITNANANVEIKLPDATVSFDKEAISSIGDQAADKNVTIVATEVEKETLNTKQKEAIKDKEVCVVLTLEAKAGDTKIESFGGGKAKISVPFTLPEGKDATDYFVAFIADDGNMTIMPTSYKDGMLSFETTHFSSYVIMEVDDDGSVPTGDKTAIVLAVMTVAIVGMAITTLTKRRAY